MVRGHGFSSPSSPDADDPPTGLSEVPGDVPWREEGELCGRIGAVLQVLADALVELPLQSQHAGHGVERLELVLLERPDCVECERPLSRREEVAVQEVQDEPTFGADVCLQRRRNARSSAADPRPSAWSKHRIASNRAPAGNPGSESRDAVAKWRRLTTASGIRSVAAAIPISFGSTAVTSNPASASPTARRPIPHGTSRRCAPGAMPSPSRNIRIASTSSSGGRTIPTSNHFPPPATWVGVAIWGGALLYTPKLPPRRHPPPTREGAADWGRE